MSRNKRPKFVGELNKPIVSQLTAYLLMNSKPSENDRREFWKLEDERIRHHQMAKLDLLLHHYDIKSGDQNRWLKLSWSLACDFIPGMQVIDCPARGKGRPKKWKSVEGIKLAIYVEGILKERNRGIRDAIRIMVKRYPDRWGLYEGKERSLEVRYAEAKKYHDQLAKNPLANLIRPKTAYEK
jgi:hypothetical protein